ncbi:MAG TPA: hypothetical protein VJY35_05370 [Candidatus Eisenbacteria bacterium]|nr:hypothetical protein [Candidatus Eisenbacteria bacterium]
MLFALSVWVALAIEPTLPDTAFAQLANPDFPSTNGTVYDLARIGNTLYVAGSFTHVGRATGGAAIVDATTGAAPSGLPVVFGAVFATVPDGSGGWYIGGQFTQVGDQPRQNLAHIQANLGVGSWNPGTDGPVRALALSGSILYVGGQFSTLGGAPRGALGAVNATTGVATSWAPQLNDEVLALATDGTIVYVGGFFTDVGGHARSYLAAIRANNGNPTGWNPAPDQPVDALVLSGTTLYAGGAFSTIGGLPRGRLAALSTATGVPNAFAPDANSTVLAIAVSGSMVYAGGFFSSIGGQTRNRVAALDATTGLATGWNPDPNFLVHALAVSGSTVYVGGEFTSIAGQPAAYGVGLDAASGAITGWNLNPDSQLRALAVSGSSVLAGGYFQMVGGAARSNLAAIDLGTGQVNAWNPAANAAVFSIGVIGSTVYLAGQFSGVGGAARSLVAAVDGTTGLATSWQPTFQGGYDSGGDPWFPAVYDIAVHGSTVYVGGKFGGIGGLPRGHLGGIDGTTGQPTAWSGGSLPGYSADYYVNTIATDGIWVGYAHGGFLSMGAINIATPTVAWTATPTGTESEMIVDNSTLYVGGNFTAMNGQPRTCLAAFDITNGTLLPWNPVANSTVLALKVSGSTLYVGGAFTTIGGQPRLSLASLDLATGTPTDWNPTTNGAVATLDLEGSTLYAGGGFSIADDALVRNLAAIEAPPVVGVPNVPLPVAGVALSSEPNPMQDHAWIRFVLPNPGRVTLDLHDIAGRRVRQILADAGRDGGPQKLRIDRDGLPGGLYFLELRSEGVAARQKLVVLP